MAVGQLGDPDRGKPTQGKCARFVAPPGAHAQTALEATEVGYSGTAWPTYHGKPSTTVLWPLEESRTARGSGETHQTHAGTKMRITHRPLAWMISLASASSPLNTPARLASDEMLP